MLLRSVLVCLCGLSCAYAQPPASVTSPNTSVAPAKADRYAGEAALIEHLATIYRYAADGTGTKQLTVAVRVQTEAAVRQFGVVTIPFAGAEEHIEFDYVRVRRPDGTIVQTPTSEALDISSEVTRQAPLYSDLKEKQLPVRSLRAGDTLEYQARIIRTVAEASGEIWGSHTELPGFVILSETVELRLPIAKVITVWSPTSKPVLKEENGERIYRWTSSRLDPTAGPEADAKKEAEKTRTVTAAEAKDLQYGKLPLIAWTTFKDCDAVGGWYHSLEDGRNVADAEIKAKVIELTSGKSTDEEKVRAIYSYVATSIRYIGVDLGIGRYQPHLASEVLRNQYGDCKDKHTLLAAMLIQAGFSPSAVLVGASIRFNPDVPSPAQFNHVITQLSVDGKTIWLDSTQEVAPYRALVSVVRDKDALIVPPTGVSRIEKTPADLPYPSVGYFEATGKLTAEGISDSHIVFTLRGDDELIFRAVVHQLSPGQYGEFIQGISQNFGFAGTTSHPEIDRPESTAEPFHLAYDYKREKPGDWENFRIYPQFPPLNLAQFDEKDPPKIALQLGLPRVESAMSAMKLPEGWGATLPADLHVKTAFANFDKTYRLDKGTLYADRKIEFLKTEVPAADWRAFKKFTDDILLNNEPEVQLTSIGRRTSVPAPPAPSINNEEAARLLQDANRDILSRRFDEALSEIDQAKKINDQQPYLWSAYGFHSYMRFKFADALELYKKELRLHPDESYVYGIMADAQLALGQRKEAEASLRSRLAEGASNERISMALAQLLIEDNDPDAAVPVLQAAAASKPDYLPIQVMLGSAQIKAGKLPEGSALLKAAIEKSDDPSVLNNAAYSLADADVELDAASRAAQKALRLLGEQTTTLTPDSGNSEIVKGYLVLAAWDTQGWILFRRHKLDAAEAYVLAAWLQKPRPEVGLHLGQIQEAKGDLNAAIMTYSLATGSSGQNGPFAARHLPSAVDKEIVARMAALSARSAKIGGREAGLKNQFNQVNSLQDLRTISLGAANGADGAREFTFVLSDSGVVAKGSEDKPSLKNEDALLKRFEIRSWWPDHSPVRILRKGIVNCYAGNCQMVYIPL